MWVAINIHMYAYVYKRVYVGKFEGHHNPIPMTRGTVCCQAEGGALRTNMAAVAPTDQDSSVVALG